MNKLKLVFTLFLTFAKIGAFTFGGGYAMIPLIEKEVIEKKKWISEDILLEVIAIAESTPGPIAINSATFIGNRVAGFWGSFAATFGVVLPSFLIIFCLSFILRQFTQFEPVVFAFEGIRVGVLALMIKALVGMYKKAPKGVLSYIIMGLGLILSAFTEIDAVFIIIGAGIAGIISSLIADKKLKKQAAGAEDGEKNEKEDEK
ncbi:MAG: chromate transporter [Clostridia bacterium]|nr:chromate transporter [Clostridia bacterium]